MENKKYEVLLILKPNLDKEDLKKLIKTIEDKLSGKIIKKEEWGLKKFAYQIQKLNEGYYILYYVETTSESIDELKQYIAITKEVIRPMILRHDKKWPFEYKKTTKDLVFPERKKPAHYKKWQKPENKENPVDKTKKETTTKKEENDK